MQIGQLLHDETIQVDDAHYDMERNELNFPVRRQFHGGYETSLQTESEWTVYEKDWMRSLLTIRGVVGWEKHDDQEIGDYTFDDWALDGETLTIVLHQRMTISVRIFALDILLTDLGYAGKARIERKGNGTEISSGTVY